MLGTPPQHALAPAAHTNSSPSLLRRPSQSVHQENHVPAKQVDGRRQDLEAGRGDYKQRDGRTRRAMGVRRIPSVSPIPIPRAHLAP